MSKTGKVLQVLRLFDDDRRQLRATDVSRLLGVSSATAYRYVAELQDAGLVESPSAGVYVLGPTIVELDRQIRVHDPLIAAAGDVMKTLAERTGGAILLARLHGQTVLCVHQVRGRLAPATVSYERGRAMPLYRGATSKIILAHLDRDELRKLIASDAKGLRQHGLPARLEPLLAFLAGLRADRVYATAGEVDAEAMGWAAPIHHGRHLLGSLSVVLSRRAAGPATARIADQVLRAALRVEGRLGAARPQPSRGDLDE
jgi:DNA-binding IclR family transcriptional regulator